MNEEINVQNLLDVVSHITSKYDDIAKITGERYNIFQILRVQTDELSHSAFIGDLLNSSGKHGLGDTFLCSFITQFKIKFKDDCIRRSQLDSFNTAKSKARLEKNIANPISSDEGGRMDIFISDNHRQIIIENKIDALDQPLQLARYHHYDNTASIFYLTKDGGLPDKRSTQGSIKNINYDLQNGNHFVCLSYKEDIIQWLELCLKETINLPLLRETIKQYIYLLKVLTDQSTNRDMENEIMNSIKENPNNIKAAFQIGSLFEKLKYQLMEDFANELKARFENANFADWQIKIAANGTKIGKRGSVFRFEDESNLFIDLQFQEDFSKVRVNIASKIRKDESLLKSLTSTYKQKLNDISIGDVLKPEPLYNWGVIWVHQFHAVSDYFNKERNTGWTNAKERGIIIDHILAVIKAIANKITESQEIIS